MPNNKLKMKFSSLLGLEPDDHETVEYDHIKTGWRVCGITTHSGISGHDEYSFENISIEPAIKRLNELTLKDRDAARHVRRVWSVPSTDRSTLKSAVEYMCNSPERAEESVKALDADASFVCATPAIEWIKAHSSVLRALDTEHACVSHAFISLDLSPMAEDQRDNQDWMDEISQTEHDTVDNTQNVTSDMSLSFAYAPSSAPPSFAPPSYAPPSYAPPSFAPSFATQRRQIVIKPPKRDSMPSSTSNPEHVRGNGSRERNQRRPAQISPSKEKLDRTSIHIPVSREVIRHQQDREKRYTEILSKPRPPSPQPPKLEISMLSILTTRSEELELPGNKDDNEIRRAMSTEQYAKYQAGILSCCATTKDCSNCKSRAREQAKKNILANIPAKPPPTGNCRERATEYLQKMKREGKSNHDISEGMKHIHCTD